MILKNSTKKTKKFFHKSLNSLRSYLFCKYQNLPKTLILNSSRSSSIHNSQILDQLSLPNSERFELPVPNTKPDLVVCDEPKEQEEQSPFEEENESKSFRLVQKMKVLEMMNSGDVDHCLDVEEALHYYARLTCPVYVDIVDKFFMDMYKDYYFPQLSISRRLGASRRFGSGRRLSSSCRISSSRGLSSSLRLGPALV